MLDAPRRRHWTLSFFRDHAIANCPNEHPKRSASAQTSRNLSEYFRASSSSGGFSFNSCVRVSRRLYIPFKLNIPNIKQ